jgi:hypothetical protein
MTLERAKIRQRGKKFLNNRKQRPGGVRQGVFASYLDVRPKLVSVWERGEKGAGRPVVEALVHRENKGPGGCCLSGQFACVVP